MALKHEFIILFNKLNLCLIPDSLQVLARVRAYVTVMSVCLSDDGVHIVVPIDTKFGQYV